MVHLSQVIGALLAEGYSVEFDPGDNGPIVASIHSVQDNHTICNAIAVGETASVALENCLRKVQYGRLLKLTWELLK